MTKPTSNPQDYELKYRRGEALTDEEYAKLMKQKELEELHSLNDEEHIRATSDRQIMKFYFIAGIVVGVGLTMGILTISGQIK